MKVSYEEHGAGAIEGMLEYLAATDADDIECDEFEMLGEDEEGREGSCEVSIVRLAGEGAAAIRDLQQRLASANEKAAMLAAVAASVPIAAVSDERARQIGVKGRTLEHDDQCRNGELVRAACAYAAYAEDEASHRAGLRRREKGFAPPSWPWPPECWKPTSPRRDLVKACALLISEIERLDRVEVRRQAGEGQPS